MPAAVLLLLRVMLLLLLLLFMPKDGCHRTTTAVLPLVLVLRIVSAVFCQNLNVTVKNSNSLCHLVALLVFGIKPCTVQCSAEQSLSQSVSHSLS